MIFQPDFVHKVRSRAKGFTLMNVLSIPPNEAGIYIFHHRQHFIYVGKSGQGQGVQERLQGHYNSSHNEHLKQWIDAIDGRLMVTPIPCTENVLDDLEKSAIRHLQPIANERRYERYNPIKQPMEY